MKFNLKYILFLVGGSWLLEQFGLEAIVSVGWWIGLFILAAIFIGGKFFLEHKLEGFLEGWLAKEKIKGNSNWQEVKMDGFRYVISRMKDIYRDDWYIQGDTIKKAEEDIDPFGVKDDSPFGKILYSNDKELLAMSSIKPYKKLTK